MAALTAKKKKFLDAYVASCRDNDLSTGDHTAAARIAGYANATAGYKLIDGEGNVKDDAARLYLRDMLAPTPAPTPAPVEYDNIDDADINALRAIRDDELAPHGARVRAAELLMKQKGIDKPSPDDDQEDPEAATTALLILLGVEPAEVSPDFLLGQRKIWNVAALA